MEASYKAQSNLRATGTVPGKSYAEGGEVVEHGLLESGFRVSSCLLRLQSQRAAYLVLS